MRTQSLRSPSPTWSRRLTSPLRAALAVAFFALAGCSGAAMPQGVQAQQGASAQATQGLGKKQGAITYATVPSPGEPNGVHPLTLDIAKPDGPGPHRALIFVHGGAWAAGDLTTYSSAIQEAARRGYVAITVNYRLTNIKDANGKPLHPWPAQIQDVNAAIRWLAHNAKDLNVDTARVGILGESAGAHLSMMATYAHNEPSFQPSYTTYSEDLVPKAVVSMAGPGDLRSLYDSTVWWIRPSMLDLLVLPSASGAAADAAFAGASPQTYMGKGPRVPLLVEHGLDDALVPPAIQRRFVEVARLLGQDVTLNEIPKEGHAAVTPGLAHAWAWLDSHL